MVKIGTITTTHGIKGEIKVINLSDFVRFAKGRKVYLIKDETRQTLVIEKVRTQGDRLVVKFAGIDNINDVLPFKGLDLYADDDISHQLEDDDYHYRDLIGKAVYDEQDVLIGHVTAMIEVPQGHLMEVDHQGKRILVPFVKAFIGEITDDRIIIHPIEGLL